MQISFMWPEIVGFCLYKEITPSAENLSGILKCGGRLGKSQLAGCHDWKAIGCKRTMQCSPVRIKAQCSSEEVCELGTGSICMESGCFSDSLESNFELHVSPVLFN